VRGAPGRQSLPGSVFPGRAWEQGQGQSLGTRTGICEMFRDKTGLRCVPYRRKVNAAWVRGLSPSVRFALCEELYSIAYSVRGGRATGSGSIAGTGSRNLPRASVWWRRLPSWTNSAMHEPMRITLTDRGPGRVSRLGLLPGDCSGIGGGPGTRPGWSNYYAA
jgi:hypothetical protein